MRSASGHFEKSKPVLGAGSPVTVIVPSTLPVAPRYVGDEFGLIAEATVSGL